MTTKGINWVKLADIFTKALDSCIYRSNYVMANRHAFDDGFKHGFEAGVEYQQKKIGAYADYIAGSITRGELDEVLNEA